MIRHLKSYRELEALSKNFNLGFYLEYLFDGEGDKPNAYFKLSNHYHPYSLKEEESQILYDLIVLNNYKSGFEVATAFGISSSAIGQALKVTGGKLVTLDAYIEESVNNAGGYELNTRATKENADGYQMAINLYKALGIDDIVKPVVGWSPDDVPSAIESSGIHLPLDFAFIDGGHSHEQIIADVNAVLPYLKDECMILFHDWNEVRREHLQEKLDLTCKGFTVIKQYPTMFGLCAYSRGGGKLI
jgi:predicted O-methyltransferase YrrM